MKLSEKLPRRRKLSSGSPVSNLQSYPCHSDFCCARHLCLKDTVFVGCLPLCGCLCVSVCICIQVNQRNRQQHLTLTLALTHTHTHPAWLSDSELFPCLILEQPRELRHNSSSLNLCFLTSYLALSYFWGIQAKFLSIKGALVSFSHFNSSLMHLKESYYSQKVVKSERKCCHSFPLKT